MKRSISVVASLATVWLVTGPAIAQTQLLWGETHLHSNLSPDAYVQRNTTATPDDAFRFAKGAASTKDQESNAYPLDQFIHCVHLAHSAKIDFPLQVY